MLDRLHADTLDAAPGRLLDWRASLSIAGAIALLLGIAGASVWQAERNEIALGAAKATRLQRDVSTDILVTALNAETSQRGFLLTLDPAGLAWLDRSEQVMPGLMATLDANLPGDKRLVRLHQAVTAKLAELRQTATLASNGNLAGALTIVRTNAGSTSMGLIRAVIGELKAEQDDRLAKQIQIVNRGSRMLILIDAAGLIMVLALAGLIALGLRDYLRVLRDAQARTARAYEAVTRNNDLLDETVRRRTAALTAANEEVQRFAYIVSHDLRAPLVNIMGFTSELDQAATTLSCHLLATDAPPDIREAITDEIPEALGYIKTSTQKMDRLINAILRLSREGRRNLVAEPLDMVAILEGIAQTMRHQADSSEAVVEVGALPPIIADRLAVEQVFGNIVENALKYLMPGRAGQIRVTGHAVGGRVRFEVADNGRGIAARDFERIFELFRRAGDQTVRGEGIGLAHVRALVRRLGGSVDCTSDLGSGSVFIVTLPAVASYETESLA